MKFLRIPPLKKSSFDILTTPSVYEWVRNYHGLTPLRANCWQHCWMSDSASIEWKSYSRPRYNYVAWLPGSTLHSVFKSTTLGTRSLFVSAKQQFEMNIQVLKNVQRLRISKSLTSDALSARLFATCNYAMRQWSRFAFGTVAPRIYGKTSLQLSRSGNSSQLWSGEFDPVNDFLEWKQQMRWEYEEAGMDALF